MEKMNEETKLMKNKQQKTMNKTFNKIPNAFVSFNMCHTVDMLQI